MLTHICLATFYGTCANGAEPDQKPQNVASDQALHCLLTECIFKRIKLEIYYQQNASDYDQEIPHSQTTDQSTASLGRATGHLQ